MNRFRWLALIGSLAVILGVGLSQPWRWFASRPTPPANPEPEHSHEHDAHIELSVQARANLRLQVEPLRPTTYWRTVEMPGSVIDQPGQSDRSIPAPVAAVVKDVKIRPGDTLRPGDPLVTLQLVSETVQSTQGELFRAVRERQLAIEMKERAEKFVKIGTEPNTKVLELHQQVRRYDALIQSLRYGLLSRGLTSKQIDAVTEGQFVTEVQVLAPMISGMPLGIATANWTYEVQELRVQLGEQVRAGQTLCVLSNHQAVAIEGRAFKHEAALLEKAARQGWPIQATFADEAPGDWPTQTEPLVIRSLSNTVDPASRTFAFLVPLANQSRSYSRDGQTFLIWRYRPGQRVRLKVPIDRVPEALVVPVAGVVRESGEAFVFRQEDDHFERQSVQIQIEDRDVVVLANDGSVRPNQLIARNCAAILNRILKAKQSAASGHHSDEHDHHH